MKKEKLTIPIRTLVKPSIARELEKQAQQLGITMSLLARQALTAKAKPRKP